MKTPIGAFNQEKALGPSRGFIRGCGIFLCTLCRVACPALIVSPLPSRPWSPEWCRGRPREICRQLPSAAATPAPAATATIFHLSEEIEMLKNTIDHINTVIWLHFMSLNKNRNGENIFCVINHSTWDEWMVAIV